MLRNFIKPSVSKTEAPDGDAPNAAGVTEDEFIPIACHFDADTLLTKNGELLQTLRIRTTDGGLDYESANDSVATIKDAIRDAIGEHLDSDKFSFWFHLRRRRRPIEFAPSFREPFAGQLHAAWQQAHRWQYAYSNEIYISILREGQSAHLFDFKEMGKTLLPRRNRSYRESYVEDAHGHLVDFVGKVASSLSAHYAVDRLTILQRKTANGQMQAFSEPLEFQHYLVNLSDADMPMVEIDASRQLATHELTFGFDAMESKSDKGKRRFAAAITIKGVAELNLKALDRCLQMPEEMVVAQSFAFTKNDPTVAKRKALRQVLEASLEDDIADMTGLSDLLAHDRGQPIDYGNQQTTLLLVRDQYKTLDAAAGKIQDAFAAIGVVSVREDIRLEECFWGLLPGNFPFVSRKFLLASARMASFMRLNYFPTGKETGNHWGNATAILPTLLNTPYFFNFHVGDNGHTALIDYNGFADERGSRLLNFLLACSRQHHGHLVVIDRNQSARPLMKALGGKYYHFGGAELDRPAMNPLSLEDTRRNRAFLVAWLSHFIRHEESENDTLREAVKTVLDQLYALPAEQRVLNAATQMIEKALPGRIEPDMFQLQRLFGSATDQLDFTQAALAFEMGPVVDHKEHLIPVFSYLLHRIILSLDGTPTIIVLNEAWDLMDNDFFTPRMVSLLDMLRQHNAMVIFTTRHIDEHAQSPLTDIIMQQTATKLYLPDDIPVDYFPDAVGLTKDEVASLLSMERQKGQFIIHHGQESVHCRFTMEGLEEYANTLAGDSRALRLMQIRKG